MNGLYLFFKAFRKGFSKFSIGISLIINSILLIIVYFIGVGITSLVAKLAGKHFLEKKISKNAKTYWTNLNLKKKHIGEYYRQF